MAQRFVDLLADVAGFEVNACFRIVAVGRSVYAWQYAKDPLGRRYRDPENPGEAAYYVLKFDRDTKETS